MRDGTIALSGKTSELSTATLFRPLRQRYGKNRSLPAKIMAGITWQPPTTCRGNVDAELENLTGEGFRNVSLTLNAGEFWVWLGWWVPDAQNWPRRSWSAYFAWRTHYAEW